MFYTNKTIKILMYKYYEKLLKNIVLWVESALITYYFTL